MKTKKKIVIALCFIFMIVSDLIIWKFVNNTNADTQSIILKMEVTTNTLDEYQVFYSDKDIFEEEKSSKVSASSVDEVEIMAFSVVANEYMRFDFGSFPAIIEISELYFEVDDDKFNIPVDCLTESIYSQYIDSIEEKDSSVIIKSQGVDSYVVIKNDFDEVLDVVERNYRKNDILIKLLLMLCLDVAVLTVAFNLETVSEISVNYRRDKKLIANLAKSDFKTKYAGSYFGIIWAFIQPIITVVVYWFVFEVGLRSGRMCDYPFILWLLCGLVPWFFFSEALGSGTNALTEYSYLVKKVVFKIDVLPMVKVLSAIFVHLFFVAFTFILLMCYGYWPDLFSLQIVYYILCTFVLVLALSYLTSSLVVFFKDLNQIIGIILQVGVWATPILWDATAVSAKLDTILRLNPVYYIVTGFRDSLLGKTWIWERPVWMIYFWSVVVILYILGRKVFKKLQIHFADVL